MTQRDVERFERVVLPYLDDAYTLARYLLRDEHDAQDVVQEAALRALRYIDGYSGGDARAWLLAIARSTALDWFRADARRRKREERAEAAERRDESGSFGVGFSPELAESLRSLSAGEREVVALRIVLDLDGEEAARLLGISPTAVSTRLSRALSKLEERMRDHDVVA